MGLWNSATDAVDEFRVESVIEILSLSLLIYLVLLLVKGTTAMSLLRGMLIIVIVAIILVEALNLTVLSWLLNNSFPALLIALPIIFQQEIRRFLERIGRTGRWHWPAGRANLESVVDGIADASMSLLGVQKEMERPDAVIVVVSEETGGVSIAANGRVISNLDGPRLRGILRSLILPSSDLDRPAGPRLPRLSRRDN